MNLHSCKPNSMPFNLMGEGLCNACRIRVVIPGFLMCKPCFELLVAELKDRQNKYGRDYGDDGSW